MVPTGHSIIGGQSREVANVLSEHRTPGYPCSGEHVSVGRTGQTEIRDGHRVDAGLVERPSQRP